MRSHRSWEGVRRIVRWGSWVCALAAVVVAIGPAAIARARPRRADSIGPGRHGDRSCRAAPGRAVRRAPHGRSEARPPRAAPHRSPPASPRDASRARERRPAARVVGQPRPARTRPRHARLRLPTRAGRGHGERSHGRAPRAAPAPPSRATPSLPRGGRQAASTPPRRAQMRCEPRSGTSAITSSCWPATPRVRRPVARSGTTSGRRSRMRDVIS